MARLFALLILMIAVLPGYGATDGVDPTAADLAGVLLRLNHFPSAADKDMLQRIIDDPVTSAPAKQIAAALKSIEHRVSAEHRADLEKLVDDESVPGPLREIARAALSVNHSLSADQKERLSHCCAR